MKIAVLGATGLVGRTMLKLLEESSWLTGDPVALASPRSAGLTLPFLDRELTVRAVALDSFVDMDIALFSAGGEASLAWGPVAVAAGAWVVDNSSAFRMMPEVPLIVPEINGQLAAGLPRGGCTGGGVIANPNCSTIQIAMAAAPLAVAFGLNQVHVTTFQAVSGAGQAAVEELDRQCAEAVGPGCGGPVFPRTIAANVIPAIGPALPDGSYEEEDKVVRELRKILGRGQDLAVSCTAVRVPVVTGHSAAIRFVCDRPVDLDSARDALAAWPGVEVADSPHEFMTPRQIDGGRGVHVGRLRKDPSDERALLCWVVADNLLKGAAWNAVQIAEILAGGAVS
jgi:aspartate-semialdehyde dehydrogenase